MASSSSWKLRALMKKNLLIMKRNACSTIFEILFPIALILLCYVIRLAFQLKKYYFKDEETDIPTYIKNTSSIYKQGYLSPSPLGTIGTETNLGFSIIPALKICTAMNDKFEARPIIASIGLPLTLKTKIMTEAGDYSSLIRFEEFSSIEQMEDRIKDKTYGKNNDLICFGIRFKQDGHKYDYSLHYFDSMFSQGVQDIPNMRNGVFDKFSTGPDLAAYRKYQDSCFLIAIVIFSSILMCFFIYIKIVYLHLNNDALAIDKIIPDYFFNIIYLVDIELVIFLVNWICFYFYFKGGQINDFLDNIYWAFFLKSYFSYILVLGSVILYIFYQSETVIKITIYNVILYSFINLILVLVSVIIIYSFFEYPLKKM